MKKSHRVETGELSGKKNEYTLKISKEKELLWANSSILSLMGASHQETAGKKCSFLLKSKNNWCTQCPLDEVLSTGKTICRLSGPKSGNLWFITMKPFFNEEGLITSVMEQTVDVSQMLQKLQREQKSQFRVVDETGIFLCDIDSKHDIEFSDEGKSLLSIVKKEDIKYLGDKLKAGIKSEFDECIKLLNGEWVKLQIIPVLQGKNNTKDTTLVGGIIRKRKMDIEPFESRLFGKTPAVFYRRRNKSLEFEFISEGCSALTGLSPEEFLTPGKNRYLELIHPDDRTMVLEILGKPTGSFEITYRIETSDKKLRWVLEKGRKTHSDFIEGFITDITNLKVKENLLRNTEKKYKLLFQNATDAIVLHEVTASNRFGKILEANEAACKLLEISREELLTLTPYDIKKIGYSESYRIEKQLIKEKHMKFRGTLNSKTGKKLTVEMNSHCFPMDGKLVILTIMRDVTLRDKWEKRIEYLSFHDYLTGLYNRAFLDEELKRLNVQRQLPISIIMGDLNGLKLVNDIFGHKEGDNLIIKTARVIQKYCREEDIVSRWGGDEFIVLLPRTTGREAEIICERIKATKMSDSEEVENFLPINIALGWATKTNKTQLIGDVIKKAEKMMYSSKMQESRNLKFSVIENIRRKFLELEYESKEHTERVQRICREFGTYLGLKKVELEDLRLLARFHDIGKIVIPKKILFKKTELTSGEKEMIKKHVEISWRIARTSIDLSRIAEGMLSHHERWDGDGYPRGIDGEKIPLITRIFAIVEAFDRMVYGTTYKEAIPKEKCLEELMMNAGTQFDPKLVTRFIGFINSN